MLVFTAKVKFDKQVDRTSQISLPCSGNSVLEKGREFQLIIGDGLSDQRESKILARYKPNLPKWLSRDRVGRHTLLGTCLLSGLVLMTKKQCGLKSLASSLCILIHFIKICVCNEHVRVSSFVCLFEEIIVLKTSRVSLLKLFFIRVFKNEKVIHVMLEAKNR